MRRKKSSDLFWFLFASFFLIGTSMKWVVFACLGIFVLLIIYFLLLDNKPACPSCGSKSGSVFMHQRVDGGPDRRYHHNPLICAGCGKTSYQINSDIEQLKVVSCHYVSMPGVRYFPDCPDFPENVGEKCTKCSVVNDGSFRCSP